MTTIQLFIFIQHWKEQTNDNGDHIKNLMDLQVPFHGNHPVYSKYVEEQVSAIMKSGLSGEIR